MEGGKNTEFVVKYESSLTVNVKQGKKSLFQTVSESMQETLISNEETRTTQKNFSYNTQRVGDSMRTHDRDPDNFYGRTPGNDYGNGNGNGNGNRNQFKDSERSTRNKKNYDSFHDDKSRENKYVSNYSQYESQTVSKGNDSIKNESLMSKTIISNQDPQLKLNKGVMEQTQTQTQTQTPTLAERMRANKFGNALSQTNATSKDRHDVPLILKKITQPDVLSNVNGMSSLNGFDVINKNDSNLLVENNLSREHIAEITIKTNNIISKSENNSEEIIHKVSNQMTNIMASNIPQPIINKISNDMSKQMTETQNINSSTGSMTYQTINYQLINPIANQIIDPQTKQILNQTMNIVAQSETNKQTQLANNNQKALHKMPNTMSNTLQCCRICAGDHITYDCEFIKALGIKLKNSKGEDYVCSSDRNSQMKHSQSIKKNKKGGVKRGNGFSLDSVSIGSVSGISRDHLNMYLEVDNGSDEEEIEEIDPRTITHTVKLNFSPESSEYEIRQLCEQFGRVQHAHFVEDKNSRRPIEDKKKRLIGVAYVTYTNRKDAELAFNGLKGIGLDNYILQTDWSNRV
jgi:hypothetical protein